MWRARLSWRSPPRLSRWRIVCPLEAGSGATPARRAKAASERTRSLVRPGDDQLRGDDRADAGFVEQFGHERTDVFEDFALELVGLCGRGLDRRASERSDEHVASSSGVREPERRKRLQRRISSSRAVAAARHGAARARSRSHCGVGRARPGGRRRRCGVRAAARAAPPGAVPSVAGSASRPRVPSRAARIASSGRPCRAIDVRCGRCGRPRAPSRRDRRGSESARRRNGQHPRSPRHAAAGVLSAKRSACA